MDTYKWLDYCPPSMSSAAAASVAEADNSESHAMYCKYCTEYDGHVEKTGTFITGCHNFKLGFLKHTMLEAFSSD